MYIDNPWVIALAGAGAYITVMIMVRGWIHRIGHRRGMAEAERMLAERRL